MQRVRCPHSAEVGEKREYVRVADDRAIEIDDRQRQPRALRQAAKDAHVDPSMVLYLFGSKEELFRESLRLILDPERGLGTGILGLSGAPREPSLAGAR